jgi:hypothetical protein
MQQLCVEQNMSFLNSFLYPKDTKINHAYSLFTLPLSHILYPSGPIISYP